MRTPLFCGTFTGAPPVAFSGVGRCGARKEPAASCGPVVVVGPPQSDTRALGPGPPVPGGPAGNEAPMTLEWVPSGPTGLCSGPFCSGPAAPGCCTGAGCSTVDGKPVMGCAPCPRVICGTEGIEGIIIQTCFTI